MKHRYTIDIETNADHGYHPYTVVLSRHGEIIWELSGEDVRTLLNWLRNRILAEEKAEGGA